MKKKKNKNKKNKEGARRKFVESAWNGSYVYGTSRVDSLCNENCTECIMIIIYTVDLYF